jgi:hypothetical protein
LNATDIKENWEYMELVYHLSLAFTYLRPMSIKISVYKTKPNASTNKNYLKITTLYRMTNGKGRPLSCMLEKTPFVAIFFKVCNVKAAFHTKNNPERHLCPERLLVISKQLWCLSKLLRTLYQPN